VFGGDAGPLRLLNEALGGQAGWLLGFALVAGIGILAATRLKRTDVRTGWLIAAGGSFLTIAAAFSQAQGIFHPYYVSQLAPFTAVLVGAGVGLMLKGDLLGRILAPAAIAAGVICELVILGDNSNQLGWLAAVLVAGGAAAAFALGWGLPAKARAAVVAAAMGLLLLAPATWSAQTVGHATSSTFPAGGPASTGGGMGGGPGGFRGGQRDGQRGFAPPGGGGGGGTMPTPPGGSQSGTLPGQSDGGSTAQVGAAMGGGGGMFGGNTQSLSEAVAYAKANGGGTIAVSSQTGAAGQLIASGTDVAAIGGFSGRESQVTADWLADAVEAQKIRYVLANSDGGGMRDNRVGASDVLSIVAETCTAVDEVDGLYDCSDSTAALRAAS
jgi:hypothetical protein